MGDSAHRLGPKVGRLMAWRDRGALYTEGLRTSGQFALLGAGVAKGAGFTDAWWAVVFGAALFVGTEAVKIVAGHLDYRFDVMREHQRLAAEQNPVTMRQVAALEKLAG